MKRYQCRYRVPCNMEQTPTSETRRSTRFSLQDRLLALKLQRQEEEKELERRFLARKYELLKKVEALKALGRGQDCSQNRNSVAKVANSYVPVGVPDLEIHCPEQVEVVEEIIVAGGSAIRVHSMATPAAGGPPDAARRIDRFPSDVEGTGVDGLIVREYSTANPIPRCPVLERGDFSSVACNADSTSAGVLDVRVQSSSTPSAFQSAEDVIGGDNQRKGGSSRSLIHSHENQLREKLRECSQKMQRQRGVSTQEQEKQEAVFARNELLLVQDAGLVKLCAGMRCLQQVRQVLGRSTFQHPSNSIPYCRVLLKWIDKRNFATAKRVTDSALVVYCMMREQDVWNADVKGDDKVPSGVFDRGRQWLGILGRMGGVDIPHRFLSGRILCIWVAFELRVTTSKQLSVPELFVASRESLGKDYSNSEMKFIRANEELCEIIKRCENQPNSVCTYVNMKRKLKTPTTMIMYDLWKEMTWSEKIALCSLIIVRKHEEVFWFVLLRETQSMMKSHPRVNVLLEKAGNETFTRPRLYDAGVTNWWIKCLVTKMYVEKDGVLHQADIWAASGTVLRDKMNYNPVYRHVLLDVEFMVTPESNFWEHKGECCDISSTGIIARVIAIVHLVSSALEAGRR